ncbi:hypothetical protein HPB51_009364 [Rhipicephalus microplus]|uniref:Kinesin motor domain-containing protein n=1 Tax=Rhipicephalus microplus TaxID=6941 RepID=A0A9J6F0Y9_RHIMP|nr:hypothetical protein HPB51_009364 [Rhipicephalus microplus]
MYLRHLGSEVQREDRDVADAHGNALGAGVSSRGSGLFFQVTSRSADGTRRLRVGASLEGAWSFRDVADDGDVEDSPALAFHSYPHAVEEPVSGQTKLFTFTVVFEPEATQEDVFEHCGIKRLIDMALDG